MAEVTARAELARLSWLVDTGPLVAYLDRTDPGHGVVADALDGFTGTLATTGAVITEAMYFLSGSPEGTMALAKLVDQSGTRVYDLCQPPELREAATLMRRYADTPMDFADATLVLLAEALDEQRILTLDRRGFATYRTRAGGAFSLVLDGP